MDPKGGPATHPSDRQDSAMPMAIEWCGPPWNRSETDASAAVSTRALAKP